MRKPILLLIFVLMLLSLPMRAQAQATITLESLTIQLWPDYDQPNVLVIYDFTLDANTTIPTFVKFQLPQNAEVVAVAKNVGGNLLTVEPTISADGGSISFSITEKTGYHLEYYVPYTLNETIRNFVFTWPGDYAVKSFNIALQKPSEATNITTQPTLKDLPADQNGFSYLATQTLQLGAQETYSLTVQYQNDSDTLSASSLTVQPSSSLADNVPGQVSVMTYLPWVLGVFAVILIVGGIGWYWYSSRNNAEMPRVSQKRIIRRRPAQSSDADKQVYCHQCGKRARTEDRFCRTCGAQLRKGEG